MRHRQHISYGTILAAKDGEPDAIIHILQYFDRYIESNSYHPEIPGFLNSGGGLNIDIKARIQEKLVDRILHDYDITRLPEGEVLEL